MKHRIGYIGYGEMGSNYHYQVANDRKDVCEDLAPTAVYDVRESQTALAKSRGLVTYDNINEFLNSDKFDIVVVATSNNFHCEMTCRALEAGKHVICEKPAAMNSTEFQKMIDASKKADRHLFIHQNRRFDVDFLTMKHAIETGRLGKINTIESSFCGGTLLGWRAFKDHGGGILFDWGVHLIDQIVYLLQEPVKSVYATLRSQNNNEVDDNAIVQIIFNSGIKANVTVSGTFLAPIPRFVVYGDNGTIWSDNLYDKNATLRYSKKSNWIEQEAFVYGDTGVGTRNQTLKDEDLTRVEYPDDGFSINQDWACLYKNIIDTIDGKDVMLVKHDEVMTVLKIIEAAFESDKTGSIIEF